MSSSINYNKQLYKKSQQGLLEAYIRRFRNIKPLREAFEKSPGADLMDKIQIDAEKYHTKHTDEFIEIETQFKKDQNARLLSDLNKIANILREFEQSFNNKHDTTK